MFGDVFFFFFLWVFFFMVGVSVVGAQLGRLGEAFHVSTRDTCFSVRDG